MNLATDKLIWNFDCIFWHTWFSFVPHFFYWLVGHKINLINSFLISFSLINQLSHQRSWISSAFVFFVFHYCHLLLSFNQFWVMVPIFVNQPEKKWWANAKCETWNTNDKQMRCDMRRKRQKTFCQKLSISAISDDCFLCDSFCHS